MSKLIKELNISDKVRFGSYKVGDNEITPVIWRIVAKNHPGYPENSVTLLTDEIIDLHPFSKDKIKSYGTSDIRYWLNTVSGFLSHFTTNEFSKILDTNIKVIKNEHDTKLTDDLIDKVFLLSLVEVGAEVNNIEGSDILPIFVGNIEKRITTLSKECYNDNIKINKKKRERNHGWMWWLRSRSFLIPSPTYVNYLGVTYRSCFINMIFGVRPALNISDETSIIFNSPDKDGIYTLDCFN